VGWVVLIQPIGTYAGFGLIAGLGGLWARRFVEERTRYISGLSDHLMLALLAGIGLAGLGMKYVAIPTSSRSRPSPWGSSIWTGSPCRRSLPAHPSGAGGGIDDRPAVQQAAAHPGVFISPAHSQVDDAREHRQIAAWNAALDATRER